jgi:ABC-type branched-subunit amino acid transport system ATPase component
MVKSRTLINLLLNFLSRHMICDWCRRLFPRTIVMDEGQVVADGLTSEILEDEQLLNAHGLEKP